MEGKTKTFSRVAGILNIVAALFLILTLFFFIVVAGFGILDADTSQGDQSSSSSSSESSGGSGNNAAEEAVGAIAVGCATAFVMAIALVVALAVLLPFSLVNIITELVIGPRCFRKPIKRGTVIYSTVLKSLTIPFFIFAALMITAVDELAGSPISELFPSLIFGYLALSIVTNVFEWIACSSARKDMLA
ncbi:MAG: hypothetical protein IK090_07940 [Clostridia bacterium]|nr:hypothetical protein [Clostridia bacterium]